MIKERETFLLLLNKHLVFFSTECLIARQGTKPRTQRGIRWLLPSKNSQSRTGRNVNAYMLWEAQCYICVQGIRKSYKRDI